MKIDYETIIRAYNEGESLNSIADAFGTYPTTVKRILEKQGVELRHDARHKGSYCVKDGEKLLAWAKAQGRLVTKAELAAIIGTKRLSPSYFIKYPELGQYVKAESQVELAEYYDKLYSYLKKNNIPYKPGDRTKLKVSVDALLLNEYSNIILHISEKPKCLSKNKHNKDIETKKRRAEELGMTMIFLSKEDFDKLDELKSVLDSLKK